MKTKTCLNCSASFTPKRTDAAFCSAKCRSAHNYQKKHRNNPVASLENHKEEAQNTETNIILKGELDSNFLIDKVANCENTIERINQQIIDIESIQAAYNSEISELKNKISAIESGDKAKLLKRRNLSDLALYNKFLNREYLSEKKKGNKFAHIRLKSEFAITSSNNPQIKIEIETYRNNLKSLVDNFDNDINLKKQRIESLKSTIDQHDLKIKELRNQLRFYEARILKYETMLLSV